MAPRNAKPDRKKKPSRNKEAKDPHRGVQAPFRVDDPRLLEILDKVAKKKRHSRNQLILIVLEKFLMDEGCWPPPAEETGSR
jgi:hypothetical protein